MGTHINETTTILDAIRRIVSTLRIGSRAAERDVGLSGAQLFVLQKLGDAPARSLNALAERTRTHQSSVSVVVTKLVERGLVERSKSVNDARQLELSLTAKARSLLKKAPDAVQDQLIAAIDRLPAPERRRLALTLAKLVDGVGGTKAAAAMFFEEQHPKSKSRKAGARRGR